MYVSQRVPLKSGEANSTASEQQFCVSSGVKTPRDTRVIFDLILDWLLQTISNCRAVALLG